MIGTETVTYGAAVTPTRSYEMVQETMKLSIDRIDSKGLRAGRRMVGKWVPGKRFASGDVEFEVSGVGFGLLLQHALGANAVTGASPTYTQTCTVSDLPLSFTMQIGRPDITGTVNPFTYTGCRINTWELSLKAGELLMFKPSIIAADETTGTALATFTDPTIQLLSYVGGVVTCGGVEVDLLDFSFKGDNKLDTSRFRLRNNYAIKQPIENSWREFTGQLTADFEGLTQYNHFVNGDELSMVATFAGAAIPGGAGSKYQVVVTANVRYDGETTHVPGPSVLQQPIPVKVVDDTATDAAALSVVYTTTDAAP